jgi:hypothetical protein
MEAHADYFQILKKNAIKNSEPKLCSCHRISRDS